MTPFLWMFRCPAWPGLTGCRWFRDAHVAGGPEHVCFGGWPSPDGTGTPVAWAAEGRRPAMTLERSMTGVSLTASRENEGASATRRTLRSTGWLRCNGWNRNIPARAIRLKRPKPKPGRCLQCECLICVRECLYMQKHKGYPRVYARQMYNKRRDREGTPSGQHDDQQLYAVRPVRGLVSGRLFDGGSVPVVP